MNKEIMFSIAIPAYKSKFLKECIDSVLAQTYKNFEIIIVNDASPQNLDVVISLYDNRHIRYYKNEVGFGAEHVVGNWNKCLEYAKGDYIICMGDDDRLLPNCLEEYLKLMHKYPDLGLYHAWTMNIDENGNITKVFLPLPEYEDVYSFIYSRLYRRDQYIGDFLFEVKKLREKGGFFDLPYACCSDDISAFMAASYNGVAHTAVPVFQYRVNSQSITNSSHSRERMVSMDLAYSWISNFLINNGSSLTNPISALQKKLSLKQIPFFYRQTLKYLMFEDMITDGRIKGLFYWIRYRKKYHYTTKLVFKEFIKSLIHFK